MDDSAAFNAKKSRAHKLKQDKFHHKSYKHSGKEHSSKAVKDEPKSNLSETKTKERVENTESTSEERSSLKQDQAPTSQSKTYNKRNLTSNWARYEKELETNISDTEEFSAATFEELVNVPITSGHFKLKYEYDWDKERAEIQAPWFQLDLQKLNSSLSTIPFYKRHEVPSNLFSEEKLQQMNLQAHQNLVSLKTTSKTLQSIMTSLNKQEIGDTKCVPAAVKKAEESVDPCRITTSVTQWQEEKDLDQLLSMNEPSAITAITEQMKAASVATTAPEKKTSAVSEQMVTADSLSKPIPQATSASTSLDDWLDTILDD